MKIENDKQVVLLNNLTKPSSLKGGAMPRAARKKSPTRGTRSSFRAGRTRSTGSKNR